MVGRRPRQLFPGLFIRSGRGPYRHRIGGRVVLDGGVCPNCVAPLVGYLTLDLSDPRLTIPCDLSALHLVYCMRCALSWKTFVYRPLGDWRMQIVLANRGEVTPEWADLFGDALPATDVELFPVTDRAQKAID